MQQKVKLLEVLGANFIKHDSAHTQPENHKTKITSKDRVITKYLNQVWDEE